MKKILVFTGVFLFGLVAAGFVAGAGSITTLTPGTYVVPTNKTVTTTSPAVTQTVTGPTTTVYQTVTTTPATTTYPTTTAATTTVASGQTCFQSPGSCGYPDPAYGNVGVPAGTNLTPLTAANAPAGTSLSGGTLEVTTPGTVINGYDINASGGNTTGIDVEANNVTIENTRITLTGGQCGTPYVTTNNNCGYGIQIGNGSNNIDSVDVKNVTITTAANTSIAEAVRNNGATNVTLDHVEQTGNIDMFLENYGNVNVTSSYAVSDLYIQGDHVENIYMSGGATTVVNHSTLLNIDGQTANIFDDNAGTAGAPACSDHLTLTGSFLAGAGYTLYYCDASTSVGSASLDVENNVVARCSNYSHQVTDIRGNGSGWLCAGSTSYCPAWVPGAGPNGQCPANPTQVQYPPGSDSNGFFPNGGYFGFDDIPYCSAPSTVWKNNVFIDGAAATC